MAEFAKMRLNLGRGHSRGRIEPKTPPRGPQKAQKTAPNEQQILSGFQERFPAFSSPPRAPLLNRPSRPRAPRGLPKGRPRLAQDPPRSDFELIFGSFWNQVGPFRSLSGLYVGTSGFIFERLGSRLSRVFVRCSLSNFASMPLRLQTP